jgi:hypothetical protein
MMKRGIVYAVGLLLMLGIVAPGALAMEGLSFNAAFGVRAIAELSESLIGGLLDAMHVVAASSDVQSGDWEQMRNLLIQFEQSELTYDAWFLLPDGSYYKAKSGLAEANLADRAYFSRVMAGETTMDDLVISRSTGRKSLVLTVPVTRDSTVIGAVGVTLYLDAFSALLSDKLRLSREIGFYAYQAGSGLICAHTDAESLLEPVQSAGITMAAGGLQVSDFLGWDFVLGTFE